MQIKEHNDENINEDLTNSENFAELFEESENREFVRGDIIFAKVIAKEEDRYLLDIGTKTEATLPMQELPPEVDVLAGDVLPVIHDRGLLRVKAAIRKIQLEVLKKCKEDNVSVFGKVWRSTPEGLLMGLIFSIQGEWIEKLKAAPKELWNAYPYPAQIPYNEIEEEPPRHLKPWVGRNLEVKILELDRRGRAVVSYRKIAIEKKAALREKLLGETKTGDAIRAAVKKITDSHVELDCSGILCKLSQKESSWYPKPNLASQFRRGDVIKVQVLGVDRESRSFHVSRRLVMNHPADELARLCPVGRAVEGEIKRALGNGSYFIRLTGIKRDAYLPAKEVVMDKEDMKEGVKIKATVTAVNRESVRVVLSQRIYERKEEKKLLAKYSKDQRYSLADVLKPLETEEE